MTTYYVRASMGNDGNTGLSPAQAWLTIDKAANTVAAGDTVYIGSGLYREQVTMDTAGASGNPIKFIGDIDGVQTGDGGAVIISAHDSPTAAPARASCLVNIEKEFIEWSFVVFDGGSGITVNWATGVTADLAYEGCVFDNCVILSSSGGTALAIRVHEGATPAGDGLTLTNCLIDRLTLNHDNNNSAHVNLKVSIRNCIFTSLGGVPRTVLFYESVQNTYSIGGIEVVNCLFRGGEDWIRLEHLKNTTDLFNIYNCVFCESYGTGLEADSCAANTINYDYNVFFGAVGTLVTGTGFVDGGNNDKESCANPMCVGGWADLMFYNKMGWSPFKPWEPLVLQDGTSYTVPQFGFAASANAPATDIYGNPRPMMRNTDDAGPVEARARCQDETGTVRTGSHSMAIKGAGYHDMHLPADAALTTVSVYARYDGNYTGSLPKLEILEIPGVADQSDIQTGASGAWEALSCAFTPTSAGYVRVRLLSQDTSADGECFFDDLAVT